MTMWSAFSVAVCVLGAAAAPAAGIVVDQDQSTSTPNGGRYESRTLGQFAWSFTQTFRQHAPNIAGFSFRVAHGYESTATLDLDDFDPFFFLSVRQGDRSLNLFDFRGTIDLASGWVDMQWTPAAVDPDRELTYAMSFCCGSAAASVQLQTSDQNPYARGRMTAFANFYDDDLGEYVTVVDQRTAGGAFDMTFRSFAAVPEPATWALMLLGFGAVAARVRRKPGQVLA